MPMYLCVQRSLPTSEEQPRPSPSEMQAMYARFEAWRQQFEAHLTDPGGKLGGGHLVTHAEQADGPFVEVKELVGGYMILTADSLEQATEVAQACPGLVRPGSGVEIIEIQRP